MDRLQSKVALVTGGANGIGAGIVRRFVDEGARVLIADVDEDVGTTLAKELGQCFKRLDVTSGDQWRDVIASCEREYGKLDCLVNNAGTIVYKTLDDHTEDDIRRVIEVNLIGMMIGSQAAIPAIERAGGGSIINMSSADGISAANALTAYCASKFGVRGFTKALALELGYRGIRVNSIHPGGIRSQLSNPAGLPAEIFEQGFKTYPAERSGHPHEVAAVAAFLASDDASYCMGTEIVVDGGLIAGHYYAGLPGTPEALIAKQNS